MQERIKNEILRYFPLEVKKYCLDKDLSNVQEFRIRVNRPLMLKDLAIDKTILKEDGQPYIVNKETLNRIFEGLCANSVYAFQDEISNGFITIFGGKTHGIRSISERDRAAVPRLDPDLPRHLYRCHENR